MGLDKRNVDYDFDVVSNREFLKEGAAVNDCKRPDRIIIGTTWVKAEDAMRELYAPINRNHDKVLLMGVRSAELTKYVANCMLATRIPFMNEMANLAERLGGKYRRSAPRYRFGFPNWLFIHISGCRLCRFVLPQGCQGADPHKIKELGFAYYGIGRGLSVSRDRGL